GRFLWKWPHKLPYPVSVAFGAPMPPTTSAGEVRQVIQKLSADCALARSQERLPVHREFLRRATRHPFRLCLIDPLQNGKVYRYAEFLAGAWILARFLRPMIANDRLVGIWLPPSAGGAFANVALTLLGKTSANLNYTSS